MAMRVFDSVIGKLGVEGDEGGLRRVYFANESMPDVESPDTSVLVEAEKQLLEYVNGKRQAFSLPVTFSATPYMRSVWQALLHIPYGEVRSYGRIAQELGNKNAARAVGMACNRNPLPLLVPCHRVVDAKGKLTGFRGGLDVKAKLLDMEKAHMEL